MLSKFMLQSMTLFFGSSFPDIIQDLSWELQPEKPFKCLHFSGEMWLSDNSNGIFD